MREGRLDARLYVVRVRGLFQPWLRIMARGATNHRDRKGGHSLSGLFGTEHEALESGIAEVEADYPEWAESVRRTALPAPGCVTPLDAEFPTSDLEHVCQHCGWKNVVRVPLRQDIVKQMIEDLRR